MNRNFRLNVFRSHHGSLQGLTWYGRDGGAKSSPLVIKVYEDFWDNLNGILRASSATILQGSKRDRQIPLGRIDSQEEVMIPYLCNRHRFFLNLVYS